MHTPFKYVLAQMEASAPSLSVESIWDFIVKGGPMMVPIAIASLVALAIIIERLISLRKAAIIPSDFVQRQESHVASGAFSVAEADCRKETSPIAEVFAVAIAHRNEPIDRQEHVIMRLGDRLDFRLRKFLKLLSVIAGIAPLMGLLGTIFGMIRAFSTVASSAEAMGKTELLAKGIYEAMITTAAGLLVAIPVLIAYHLLSARVDRLMLQMDEAASRLMDGMRKKVESSPALTGAASRTTGFAASSRNVPPGDHEGPIPDVQPSVAN